MLYLLAESYVHRLDPFAFRISGSFGVRWYGLAYAAGFLIAWWIIRRMAMTGRSMVKAEVVGDLMLYVIVGVLVGGRLGYVLFYEPSLLTEFSSRLPYWSLLAINKGGMASHGGMLGLIAACWIFGRRNGVGPLHLFDLGAFTCPPGLFLGRLTNFVNAELWGVRLPDRLQDDPPWWSVKYPTEITDVWVRTVQEPERHPPEVVRDVADRLQQLGELDVVDPLVGSVPERIVAFAQDGDPAVIEAIRSLLTAYYPSQIFQAITDGPVLMGVLALIWLGPRRPGVIGGWFLIVYGLLRILTEVVRQPDEGVDLLLGLSRGQVLSVVTIVVGAIAVAICGRRGVAPIGGLLRTSPSRAHARAGAG